jgi:hypothetical protein
LKGDISNLVSFDLHVDREVIPTERIEAFGLVIRFVEFAVISWSLAVLQNHLLI